MKKRPTAAPLVFLIPYLVRKTKNETRTVFRFSLCTRNEKNGPRCRISFSWYRTKWEKRTNGTYTDRGKLSIQLYLAHVASKETKTNKASAPLIQYWYGTGYASAIWNSAKWNSVKWNETRRIGAIFGMLSRRAGLSATAEFYCLHK